MRNVVLFDGDCLFCQARVRWLRARDRDGALSFAPIQGELGARLLAGTEWMGAEAGAGAERRAGTEWIGGASGPGVAGRGSGSPQWGGDRWASMVLVKGADTPQPEIFVKSRAVAAVASLLPFPWRLGGLLALVPRGVGDAAYDWVARRRHRWGRGEACEAGSGGLRSP